MKNNEDHWTSAIFRIVSDKMGIEDISAMIKTQPTSSYIKGELSSKRNPVSQIRGENLWILESILSDQDTIDAHIAYFLSFIKEREESIIALQADCEFDIHCAYAAGNGQGGFTLDHRLLKELTAFPVDLNINLYPPERKGEDF